MGALRGRQASEFSLVPAVWDTGWRHPCTRDKTEGQRGARRAQRPGPGRLGTAGWVPAAGLSRRGPVCWDEVEGEVSVWSRAENLLSAGLRKALARFPVSPECLWWLLQGRAPTLGIGGCGRLRDPQRGLWDPWCRMAWGGRCGPP